MRFHVIVCALVLSTLSLARVARADVPGPKETCDVEGRGCTSCWKPYGASPDGGDPSAFSTCSADAEAKGLVDACQDNSGAGDNHYFCPKGVSVEKKTAGGCSIRPGACSDATAGFLAALCLASLVRRRRKAGAAR